MDKNFIKIDDLVKLKLSGVEETERSGAWLNMRELLDKEMPQDRTGGIIYWRRTFSVVAALSLLATIGIGGYELSSSFKNRYSDGNMVVADAPNAVPEKSSEVNNVYQLQEASAEKKREIAARIASAANGRPQEKGAGDNAPQKHQHQYAAGNTLRHTEKGAKTAPGTETKNTTGSATATVNDIAVASVAVKNSNPVTGHKNAAAHEHTNTRTAGNTEYTSNKEVAGTSTAVPSIPVTAHDAQPKHEHGTVTKDASKTVGIKTTHTLHHKDAKTTAPAATGIAANKNNSSNKKSEEKGNTKSTSKNIDKLALGSAASLSTGNNTTSTIAEKKLDAGVIAAKTADKTTTKADNKLASGASSASGNKNVIGSTDKTAAPNGSITGANVQKLTAVSSSKVAVPRPDDPALKSVSVMNMSKGKKVIERMILHEHFIKTSPSEGYFKLDTISVETVTTELALNNSNAPQHTIVKKQGANASATPSKPGEIAGGEEATTDASGNIVPAATANSQAGIGLKAANAADKSTGSKIVQKLNAAFNDVKYKFGSPKFQPGVTAGINSTFFGPHSFKGFQFGITGNIMFNDQWAILSELKYFHRINGNTSIEDDYNTYTPTGNGQFSKQLQQNSYSFSALHSLELPVSIRYCMGNFNFFAGGNLVYTFSINTGAETIPSTTAATLVSAPGNDNAPQLKEDDFRSRIGLGYLLGLSYNVAPSTMLDLRSVQTVWDNASGTGAKMISSQLYKSPSLQLSIIYRLGGNRAKE